MNTPPEAEDDFYYATLTGQLLEVEAPGVLGNDWDAEGDPLSAVLDAPPGHAASFTLHADGSFDYTSDNDFSGMDTFTYYAFDGQDNSESPATVWIRVDPFIDLDAHTIQDNASSGILADELEHSEGAYLPLNSDDDDYDAGNTPDMNQGGAIEGEDDLLPIVLRSIQPTSAGGEYTLSIPSNVRVWQNADRTGSVSPGTTFDATADTTLYVEGVIGNSTGSIAVNWTDGQEFVGSADSLLTRVLGAWVGPLNVPQYGIYSYSIVGGADGLGNSKWLAPTGGTQNSNFEGEASSDPDVQWIYWDTAPVVGKARYQAHPQYVWNLGVNVVQIDIGASNIDYENPAVQNPGDQTQILSVSDAMFNQGRPAMLATLTVNTIAGPVVNGQMRGVKFMEMGFVQNLRFTQKHADYDFDPQDPNDNLARVSSLEGATWYLDALQGGTLPWYNSDPAHFGFFAPPNDIAYANRQFIIDDTPVQLATDTMVLSSGTLITPVVSDHVDRFDIELDFNLYFAIRTTASGGSHIYVQRAKANWEFNGSGTINEQTGVWTSSVQDNNTGSGSLAEETNGETVPVVLGPIGNDLTEEWSTVEQWLAGP